MLIFFFKDFGDDGVQRLIRCQNHRPCSSNHMAPRFCATCGIIYPVPDKANGCSRPLESSNINSGSEQVLCKLETKHFLQTFRNVLAIRTYTNRDQRVGNAFKITFKDNLFPTAFLSTGSYIQRDFGVVRKESTLYVTDVATIFELLVWFHCPILVHTEVYEMLVSVSMTYRTGNIVGLVVKSVGIAWTSLSRCVGLEALRSIFYRTCPIIWKRYVRASYFIYEQRIRQDGYPPLIHCETRITSILPIHSGRVSVDEPAAGCDPRDDHAMRHLAWGFSES